MCQILSLFKIDFRNNKINFVTENGDGLKRIGVTQMVNGTSFNRKYLWL
jgi:hypothetical protein